MSSEKQKLFLLTIPLESSDIHASFSTYESHSSVVRIVKAFTTSGMVKLRACDAAKDEDISEDLKDNLESSGRRKKMGVECKAREG